MTARSADGTGSGYYAGDHFDLARLDVEAHRRPGGGQGRALARAEADRARRLSRHSRAAGGRGSDRLPDRQLRRADRRRGPQRVLGQGRQDARRRGAVQRAAQSVQRSDASPSCRRCRAPTKAFPRRGCRSSRPACSRTSSTRASGRRSASASRRPGRSTTSWRARSRRSSIDDMIKGMERGLLISRFWYVRLVDPRTIVLTGLTRDGLWWIEKGQIRHPVRNLRFNQSVLAMLAPWNVEAIGAPQRLSPLMVPALKLARSRSRRSPTRSEAVRPASIRWRRSASSALPSGLTNDRWLGPVSVSGECAPRDCRPTPRRLVA